MITRSPAQRDKNYQPDTISCQVTPGVASPRGKPRRGRPLPHVPCFTFRVSSLIRPPHHAGGHWAETPSSLLPPTHWRHLPQQIDISVASGSHFLRYYGWVQVLAASVAMSATLPGRTHGLSLITEPLLADLDIARTTFANLNVWCSLLGAAFCLPIGALLDRVGVRKVSTVLLAALAASVYAMSRSQGVASLFVTLLLVRGLGQSALSIAAMAMIGTWFGRRTGAAMGLFSVLLTIGFIAGILSLGAAVPTSGWRAAWSGLALLLAALVPVCWLVVRDCPKPTVPVEDVPAAISAETSTNGTASPQTEFTLIEALRTPAFWVFVLGTSLFNLVWSAVTLFNESILGAQGFDQAAALGLLSTLTGLGLLANLVTGAIVTRERIGRILAVGLGLLAAALLAFPSISSPSQVHAYALVVGISGGMITVIFFAAWSQLFGRRELGRIQGAAQLMTVLASATGPVLMAECEARTGSYHPMFHLLGTTLALLALAAWLTPAPQSSRETPAQAN
jgi:MFS family permease